MSAIGWLVGIIILVVIISYAGTSLFTTLINLAEQSKGYLDAYNIPVKPKSYEDVCTLSITVFGELVGETAGFIDNNNPFAGTLVVRLGKDTSHPEIARYDWVNCHKATQYPLASLIGSKLDLTFQPQVLLLTKETIHAEIVLRSPDGTKIDAHTQPTMQKALTIPAGIVKLPFSLEAKFVVLNVPKRDYQMDIYYGRPINQMTAGQPLVYQIVP